VRGHRCCGKPGQEITDDLVLAKEVVIARGVITLQKQMARIQDMVLVIHCHPGFIQDIIPWLE